jgi:hypothetical protein
MLSCKGLFKRRLSSVLGFGRRLEKVRWDSNNAATEFVWILTLQDLQGSIKRTAIFDR